MDPTSDFRYYEPDCLSEHDEVAMDEDIPDGEIITLMSMLPNSDGVSREDFIDYDVEVTSELAGGYQHELSEEINVEPVRAFTNNIEEILAMKKSKKMKKDARIREASPVYRKYNDKQISFFISLLIEGIKIKHAAEKAGLAPSTAYYYKDLWNKHLDIPARKRRGPKKSTTLNEEHTMYVIRMVDSFSPVTLAVMREKLMAEYPDVRISKSSFYRFIKDECCLSIKKLEKIVEYRTLEKTIESRKLAVQSWREDTNMNFLKNCIFLDEAGFNLHISRTRGWAIEGQPSKTTVPKVKGTNITILGAICHAGVVSLSLRKPSNMSSKKRKNDGTTVNITSRVGTRAEHFMDYLHKLMDTLDNNNLQGYYILMDNASIHKSKEVAELISSRGYHCRYIPTYSPFLNPIEEFWSKIKYHIKRRPFDTGDTLTPRIMEACSKVTKEDCQGWIRHSISYFPRCLNSEKL